MIDPSWKRIAGMQAQDDGDIAIVWLAHDPLSDTVHVYDSALIKREVLAVVAEAINARGRWIPVAWHKEAKEIADDLLGRGVRMTYEHTDSSQPAIEAAALDIWERMRSHRFKVDKRLGEWLDEYKTFYRRDQKVPKGTHPLMAATRAAVSLLSYAKRQNAQRDFRRNHPKVAII